MRVRRRGPGRQRGFTLVELMFAIAIIATSSLMLCLTISSQNNMNALARERSLATNAIRSYVEAMRQKYPSKGSLDMSGFLNDATTPADYLPQSALEKSAMRDGRGLVLKMSDEKGFSWGTGASSVVGTTPGSATLANWPWLDNTMTTTGTITTGTYTNQTTMPWTLTGGRLTNTPVASGAYYPNLGDLDSMGYVSLGTAGSVVGRDLNGDASISNTDSSGSCVLVTGQIFCPCQITLSWRSGSSTGGQISGTNQSRQRITLYAAFGPVH